MTPQQKAVVKILNGEVKARIIEKAIDSIWDGTDEAKGNKFLDIAVAVFAATDPELQSEGSQILEHIYKCLYPHISYITWAESKGFVVWDFSSLDKAKVRDNEIDVVKNNEEIQWNLKNWMRELARQYRAGEIG